MSEHYLPIDVETPDKREIGAIAVRLQLDHRIVFYHCVKLWFWFDLNSTDGSVEGASFNFIDTACGLTGLCEGMADVGWLLLEGDIITMVGFQHHRVVSHKELKQRFRARKSTDLRAARENLLSMLPQEQAELVEAVLMNEAQQVCAKTRRNPTTRSGPVRTGIGVSDFPELAPWIDRHVTSEQPPEGWFDGTSAFKPLKSTDLKKPNRLLEWHRRQLTLSRPVVGSTVAEAILVLAMARRLALAREGVVKNKIAAFSSNVGRGEWDKVDNSLQPAIDTWKKFEDAGVVDRETNWIISETNATR
jgi:hypothetical protein